MYIDKVYIISIDHREEYIQELLERANMLPLPYGTKVEVFEGYVGKRLIEEEGQEYTLYDGWELPESTIKYDFWNRPTTYGEAGGMISHTRCWEDAYKNGYNTIMILEDDFVPRVPIDWTIFEEMDDYEWDLCLMSHNSLHRIFKQLMDSKRIGKEHFVRPSAFYNTHTYILKRTGIEKLVEKHLPTLKKNIIVSDEFLSAVIASHPRDDVRKMFVSNLSAIATKVDYTGQTRFQDFGNSLTEPTEDDLKRQKGSNTPS